MIENMVAALLTWSCGHFAIVSCEAGKPEHTVIADAVDDFWFLHDSAGEDLANVPTDHHVDISSDCPRCGEPVGLSFWQHRAQAGIETLQYMHEGSKKMYLETGAKYFQLDFSQKAKFAHDPRCAAAHQQYWISRVPKSSDPFFVPMDTIAKLCDEADRLLAASKTEHEVRFAFVPINKARAQVGKITGPLDDLLSGLEVMFTTRSKNRENSETKSGLISREAMVSIPKAMDWFARMEEWRDEAVETTYEMLR